MVDANLDTTSALRTGAPSDAAPAVLTSLYFGSARDVGPDVSVESFAAFVRNYVATRFPDGFTSWAAMGQWKGGSELSHVLTIVHDGGTESAVRIEEIRTRYAQEFAQQSVLRVDAAAVVSFDVASGRV